MPRRRRPFSVIGLAIPALAALAFSSIAALAQTPPFDSSTDLLAPTPEGNPNPPQRFRRPNDSAAPAQDQAPPAGMFTTPSRIGATPVYGTSPGFGAGETGFDSSNTGRRKRLAQPPPPAVPGQAQPEATFEPVPTFAPAAPANPAPPPPPEPPDVQPLKAANRRGAVLPPLPDTMPVSNPPAQVYPLAAANRPGAVVPIPPPLEL